MDKALLTYLEFFFEGHYSNFREIPGRGVCALEKGIAHWMLYHDLTVQSKPGHWCYPSGEDAIAAIHLWNGEGDPPGNWDVYKGESGRRNNPNYIPGFQRFDQ